MIEFDIGQIYELDPVNCHQGIIVALVMNRNVGSYVDHLGDADLKNCKEVFSGALYLDIIYLEVGTGKYKYYKFLYDNKYYLIDSSWMEDSAKLKVKLLNHVDIQTT